MDAGLLLGHLALKLRVLKIASWVDRYPQMRRASVSFCDAFRLTRAAAVAGREKRESGSLRARLRVALIRAPNPKDSEELTRNLRPSGSGSQGRTWSCRACGACGV